MDIDRVMMLRLNLKRIWQVDGMEKSIQIVGLPITEKRHKTVRSTCHVLRPVNLGGRKHKGFWGGCWKIGLESGVVPT